MTYKMEFPETWEDFEAQYAFPDIKEVYTNGARLIPSFRVKQWLNHLKGQELEKKKDYDFLIRCTVMHIDNLIANLEELRRELETPIPVKPEVSE